MDVGRYTLILMQKAAFSLLLFLICSDIDGQAATSTTIHIKERDFEGVIFPSDYKAGFNFGAEYLTNRFTPTLQNIEAFERGFIEQLNTLDNPFRVSDPKKFFKRHKRQYLGYISNKGDSTLVTQFVDNGCFLSFRRRARFSGWKNYFILCFDDFLCERYLKLYQFNLITKKLEGP